jgi:asparagine synthase (glutamine-hydrolysing)
MFGGYLYFHKAPNAREFHAETIRKLDALYNYDCLRANKSMMAWGVEARVPFLDTEFLDVAMRMDAKHKMIDKSLARGRWKGGAARGLRRLSARKSCGGRRNSSAMASAMAGSTG